MVGGPRLFAFVALPIVLVEAFRIIRSLHAVTAAAWAIAGSSQAVASVSPVVTTMADIAARCRRLHATVTP